MKKNNTLAAMMLVSVFVSMAFLQACNVSTANLSDVKLCTEKNSSNVCDSDASTFPSSTPVIYCSANLKNAPSGTKVTFEWKHGSESLGKADVETSSGTVVSNFTTNGAVEPGSYSVTVKINTDNSTPITREFTIE
ncbi:MAG: hypothetical protein IAE93_13100 [Ignavibacteria bacterium]|nr:hypothetical protein [Ignavibacteria bacterium]HRJ85381.1 hypothetical protein [Ignavibacteria bacterium]